MGDFVKQCLFVDHYTGTTYEGYTCYHMYWRVKYTHSMSTHRNTPYLYY